MKTMKRMLSVLLLTAMLVSTVLSASAASSVTVTDMSQVTVVTTPVGYSGSVQKAQVTVTYNGKTLVEGTDYVVIGDTTRTRAGSYPLTVQGIGAFTGTKATTFVIGGQEATITVKKSASSVKASKVKKKAKKITLKVTSNSKGKVTYSVDTNTSASLKKYIKVSKKGVITLKKGAKKGTYYVSVKVAGKGSYAPTTKIIKVVVK